MRNKTKCSATGGAYLNNFA